MRNSLEFLNHPDEWEKLFKIFTRNEDECTGAFKECTTHDKGYCEWEDIDVFPSPFLCVSILSENQLGQNLSLKLINPLQISMLSIQISINVEVLPNILEIRDYI